MPQTREHILLARQVSVPAMLRTDKGRRKTPFFNGYKPEFFFRTTDVTSQVALGDEVQDGDAG